MARKKQQQAAGAPEWMVTYSDMVTLLLCFFVVIVSFSEIKSEEKFFQMVESLRIAFGGYEGVVGDMPDDIASANTLIERLKALALPSMSPNRSDTDDPGLEGRKWRVTDVRDGTKIVVGGQITFERFSAELKPEALELIAQTAGILDGQNLKITVTGHATREPLPADAVFQDAVDLSFARARAVRDALIENGIRAERIVCMAAGDSEPLVSQAYTEERLALNRRVEIVVTEDTVQDYQGATQPPP